jgi:hypothetical protein
MCQAKCVGENFVGDGFKPSPTTEFKINKKCPKNTLLNLPGL